MKQELISNDGNFPIELKITIEDEKDLATMWHQLNIGLESYATYWSGENFNKDNYIDSLIWGAWEKLDNYIMDNNLDIIEGNNG